MHTHAGLGTTIYLAPILFMAFIFLFSLIGAKAKTVWIKWLFRVVAAGAVVAILAFGIQLVRLNLSAHG